MAAQVPDSEPRTWDGASSTDKNKICSTPANARVFAKQVPLSDDRMPDAYLSQTQL